MFDQEDYLTLGWALKQFAAGCCLGFIMIVPIFIAAANSGYVQ